MSGKPELCYYPIQGLAETNRLLLAYLKADYQENNDVGTWGDRKQALLEAGELFPNLPYFKDENGYHFESTAIMQYVAHKYKKPELLGKDFNEQMLVATLLGVVGDIVEVTQALLWQKKSAEECSTHFDEKFAKDGKIIQKLQSLDKLAGKNGFLTGNVTLVDIKLWYTFDMLESMSKGLKKDVPWTGLDSLKAWRSKFAELDGVKEYLASEGRKARPMIPQEYTKCPLA